MADRQKQALASLDRVVTLLERVEGLDASWHESTGGWTIDTRARWLARLADLRVRLLAGEVVLDDGILRDLDSDGIVGGDVPEAAADLDWRLDRLRDQRSKRAADGR